ncbi:MAG: carbon-nitrogen hydrolase family protein [Planctomycetes bacterium]|nr:carbon-nitrogen hydrolase family protein [Planctomycetota bacterium]
MAKSSVRFNAAVVQMTPMLFDREVSVEKVCALVREAAAGGARLVAFPEASIPGYPRGLGFGTVVGVRKPEGRLVWQRYWENAVEVPGDATKAIGAAAREAEVFVTIGVIERETRFGAGALYCTLLYFGPDGALLAKHRKLKPTAAERLIWGDGDGSTLTVVETEIGRIGGLCCWENYMPMARMALYSQGIDIYVAPTVDDRDSWPPSMRHIAFEGRCYLLGSCQYFTKADYPKDADIFGELDGLPEVLCRGGSAIVSPMGEFLAGPVFGKETILYADIDLAEVVKARYDFDVAGDYARSDVFRLLVNTREMTPAEFSPWPGGPPLNGT